MNLSALWILFWRKSCVVANDTRCEGERPEQPPPDSCHLLSVFKRQHDRGARLNSWELTLSSDMRPSVMMDTQVRPNMGNQQEEHQWARSLAKQKAGGLPFPVRAPISRPKCQAQIYQGHFCYLTFIFHWKPFVRTRPEAPYTYSLI